MSPELDKKLVEACPNLYRDRYGNMQETAMCWGFDFDDGWFDIIWDLSNKLEKLILEEPEENRVFYKAVQAKEKFGGLRLYMHGSTKEMNALISASENLSLKTCEICGRPGKPNNNGWIKTLCLDCKEKQGYYI